MMVFMTSLGRPNAFEENEITFLKNSIFIFLNS